MHQKQSDYLGWHPPEVGFKVTLDVASATYKPEELTSLIGIQPTETRYMNEVRKRNRWRLESEQSLYTIQEQIDDILTRVQPYASRFADLESCQTYLSVYIYPEVFEKYHHRHPSFDLEEKWMDLLHQMRATFVLD